MAGSTTKKALIRRFHRETLAGYINPVTFLQPVGVELLSADGQVAIVPYDEVKTVSFVREFDPPDGQERQVFQTRPKMAGLWVSFGVVPPDPYGNRQRVFVPRAAVLSVEVLGVVGSPLKKRKAKPEAAEQIGLFDEQ